MTRGTDPGWGHHPSGDARRRAQQRSADSSFGATLAEESLFEAMGVDGDGADGPQRQASPGRPTAELFGAHDASDSGSGPSSRGASGWAEASQPADSRFLSRHARRIVSEGGSTFERLYRTFVGARAVLGLALVAAQLVSQALGSRTVVTLVISVIYATQAVALWVLPRFRGMALVDVTRLSRRQWAATIGFDLLAFSALHSFETTTTFNYVALLVLPVLMGGVLTARALAVATAAAASLMLLAAAWRAGLTAADATATLTPAALTGIGLFVVALLAGELAGRLAREESAARGSLELARQQAQLNRLVIEEMADGVLVVDRRARVRAANPAARRLLVPHGLGRAAPFYLHDEPAWAALGDLVRAGFEAGQWSDDSAEATLNFPGGQKRTLRLRARFTRPRERTREIRAGEPEREAYCVLFLEDLRSVQARMRQEKLAAMGRVSAGVAHEIRNPLAAIAQANALLREDAKGAEQEMLTAMVADNVDRLKRIVDDVMEVAPGPDPNPRPIDLGLEVGRIVADWARTSQVPLGSGSRLQVELPSESLAVVFDPEHLRRVLVNLLDNARRYATARPGAILLLAHATSADQARVSVASDGDPIPPDVEPFLFEPFFSTRSRGTGLGLYICRELCERYGGSIDYLPHSKGSAHVNEFVVMMRRVPDPDGGAVHSRLL